MRGLATKIPNLVSDNFNTLKSFKLQTVQSPLQVTCIQLEMCSSWLMHRCLSIKLASNFFKLLGLSAAHVINPRVLAEVRPLSSSLTDAAANR